MPREVFFHELDIATRYPVRERFTLTPNTLYLFPDNLSDSSLSFRGLHRAKTYTGLAECFRPKRVGGNWWRPVYDLMGIGIPTVSENEPLTPEPILAAFEKVYRLIGSGEVDEIIVPYIHGVPAFVGELTGTCTGETQKVSKKDLELICLEITRLQLFLKGTVLEAKLPHRFQEALANPPSYVPLVKIHTPKNAKKQTLYLKRWLDNEHPLNALMNDMMKAFPIVALGGLALYPSLNTLFITSVAGLALLAGKHVLPTFEKYAKTSFMREKLHTFFGNRTVKIDIPSRDKWYLNGAFDLKSLAASYPYKTPLAALEKEVRDQLTALLSSEEGEVMSNKQHEIDAITKFRVREIYRYCPTLFYCEEGNKINSKDYDVSKADIQQYRLCSFGNKPR